MIRDKLKKIKNFLNKDEIKPDFSNPATDIFKLREQGKKINVYQVDVTNHCNAACYYCPHPDQMRAKGFMSLDTFEVVLDITKNKAFHLHHFSEPLLNKNLPDMVKLASNRGFDVGFSTNGELLTQDKLNLLADNGLKWIRFHTTAHKKNKQPFNVRLHDFSIPDGVLATEHKVGDFENDAPEKELVSYGGHIDLQEKDGWIKCSYLGYPNGETWRVVLWDGSFALCCVDMEGNNDKSLCNDCRGFVFDSAWDWGNYDG